MIGYGLLSYHDGELLIPNKELMLEFQKALKDDDFGYISFRKESGLVMIRAGKSTDAGYRNENR